MGVFGSFDAWMADQEGSFHDADGSVPPGGTNPDSSFGQLPLSDPVVCALPVEDSADTTAIMVAEIADDPREACDALAEPMGQFLGGAVAVPAFAAAAAPFVETGPGAVFAGTTAAYTAYDTVHDVVAENWSSTVCAPLERAFEPEPQPAQPDWSDTSPFSPESQSPFQASSEEIAAPPEMSVTVFDSSPSDFGYENSSSGSSSTYEEPPASYSSPDVGSPSDSGGTSSSD